MTQTSGILQPRPAWQILAAGWLLAGWVFLVVAYQGMRSATVSDPIWVIVTSDRPGAETELRLIHVFYSGYQDPPIEGAVHGHERLWLVKGKWARSLLLAGSPDTLGRVASVSLRMGHRTWEFPRRRWRQQCPVFNDVRVSLPLGWEVRDLTASLPRPTSWIPRCRILLNYPGDMPVAARSLARTAIHPSFVIVMMTVVIILTARWWLPRGLRNGAALEELLSLSSQPARAAQDEGEGRRAGWVGFVSGLVLVLGCLAFLEIRQPYYFAQDDNFSQFLPGIVGGCRAAMAGEMPNWTPYQCLGAPLAEVGTYALTYPLTYLSYGLAYGAMGDEFATLEVFCWLHLAGGYAACFWLGRHLGLSAPLAAALGLCWALCGYALIGGRSWYYMTPSFLWYPLLALAVLWLERFGGGWRWILGTALAIGLFFHAGNAQMWAYGMVFFCLLVLWGVTTGSLAWRRLPAAASALAIGLGLASVLILPQMLAIQGIERTGGGGHNIFAGVHAIFFPYPIARTHDTFFWTGTDVVYVEHFYYAGTVFSVAWLIGLSLAAAFRGPGRAFWRNPYFALSVLALVLALGQPAGLWPLQAHLPVFNKFGHPLKYLPLYHLFALSVGAVLVQRLLHRTAFRALGQRLCLLVLAALMLYHVWLARPSFYTFGDIPYPALPTEMHTLLSGSNRPVRVLPICPLRSPVQRYSFSLQHQFPTVYGIEALTGYDPLVEKKPEYLRIAALVKVDFARTIRTYGVTHLVLHRLCKWPVWNGNRLTLRVETESLYQSRPVQQYCDSRTPILRTEDVWILRVDDPDPLAFPAGDRRRALGLERTGAGLKIDVSGLPEGGPVVVNYLWYPRIRLTADGAPVASSADCFGRIEATVPPGTKTLLVRYETPWFLGIAVGFVLAAAGTAGHVAAKRWGAVG